MHTHIGPVSVFVYQVTGELIFENFCLGPLYFIFLHVSYYLSLFFPNILILFKEYQDIGR